MSSAPNKLWQCCDRTLDVATRPLVMGIVNVTPDSFSDGGLWATAERAVEQGLRLVQAGADILDVGGESTRPGSQPVDEPEELKRVQPVIAELARQVSVPISIDTSKAAVARAALDAGAIIINDVTALRGDPEMVAVARESGAGVVLMHMQGTPQTMHLNPAYEDVVAEVKAFFSNRLTELQKLGLNPNTFCLDPGIGFGKRTEHNFQLLAHLAEFGEWGHPVCLGVSRKGLIDRVCQRGITERMPGSVALASFAMAQGAAQIFRVHDVAETRDAALLWQAIQARKPTAPIG